jgi:serine phosphatase RsbU (regulator of sigma subunit)
MFEHSTYTTGHVIMEPDDLVAVYSDGITEAENPAEIPFDEIGLETALKTSQHKASLSAIGADVVHAVERHTAEKRFADDLTILLLRRTTPAPVGV